jgi:hypothetical protein
MTVTKNILILIPLLTLEWIALSQTTTAPNRQSVYTADGQLNLPSDYRQWVYLSTGFDMSYSSTQPDHHMFDNVFVNPEAWRAFQSTGKWPDKTIFVLEVRGAQGKGSINQKGNFQEEQIMGLEVHIKDESRFPSKWAFFGFRTGKTTADMIPLKENCYSCHSEHGAVDTTFVQFYPTLSPIAKRKGTLDAAYLKEEANR